MYANDLPLLILKSLTPTIHAASLAKATVCQPSLLVAEGYTSTKKRVAYGICLGVS